MSNYQIKIYDFHNIAICNAKNLVINVFDKDQYALHYENLQLYLRNTLRLKKIHRILEFNQSQMLKPYTEFSTEERTEQKQKKIMKSIAEIYKQC